MNKEEAVVELIKGFRIALNNAVAYTSDHPYFLKSAQEFKEKISTLFEFLKTIRINFTTNSLILDGQTRDKSSFDIELARFFHLRKIKGIEFKPGLSIEELVDFLKIISLPAKEMLKDKNIFNKIENSHILIDELDYSTILRGNGSEIKEIWPYLFKEIVQGQDNEEISKLASDLPKFFSSINISHLLEDESLRDSIKSFINYLKANNMYQCNHCTNNLASFVLAHKESLDDQAIEKLKDLFMVLDEGEFAMLLAYQLGNNKSFDALSLELFSKLSSGHDQAKVAGSVLKDPKAAHKLSDLLSADTSKNISPAYRKTLEAIFKDISFEERISFDYAALRNNFYYIILNLLIQEEKTEKIDVLIKQLEKESQEIVNMRDYKFLKYLLGALKNKQDNLSFLKGAYQFWTKRVTDLVEDSIFSPVSDAEFIGLLDIIEKSYKNADYYLDKIFNERNINPYALNFFFKFFPLQLDIFYNKLKENYTDLELLSQIIESMERLEPLFALKLLKEIYSFSNEIIKIQILGVMQKLPKQDFDFLLEILKKSSPGLKKQALSVLLRNEQKLVRGLTLLLTIHSPMGRRNNLLIENMGIIEELDLRSASDQLKLLSKKPFFWNRNIRKKAKAVLEGWK